jgi:hypothetical protein
MTQEIDLVDLKKIVDRIIDHAIETRGRSRIALERNFYWCFSSPDVYAVDEDAPQPDVGSLYDDWSFVKAIATEDQEPLANNLATVSQLMRYIGELLGDELAKHGG